MDSAKKYVNLLQVPFLSEHGCFSVRTNIVLTGQPVVGVSWFVSVFRSFFAYTLVLRF